MINSAGMWRKFVNSAKSAITDSGIGLAMGDSFHSEPACSTYYNHSLQRMDESGYNSSAMMTRSAYGTCWMMMQQTENHSNASSSDNDWGKQL